MLRLAGVSTEQISRAFQTFPGLGACHPQDEVLRRLEHLNFLIHLDIYTFNVAKELIATQPWFLQMRFEIIHEDEDLVVMNKPNDVRMDIPKREGDKGERKWPTEYTCADFLDTFQPPLEKKRFVHNLDSATSGVLICGKTKSAAARCVDLFSKRLVEKECKF